MGVTNKCIGCLQTEENAILKYEIDRLRAEVLGANWFIVDPVGGCQACEIIIDEVIHQFKKLEELTAPWYVRLYKFIKSGFGGEQRGIYH